MLVLLDNGHGGLINGQYQTPGKRSPRWPDGTQLYEGEFNRAIVNGIIEQLTILGIPYVNIAPEYVDISLYARVQRASVYTGKERCFYLSVHANAGGGRGWEVWTSPGQTRSDEIAEIFAQECANEFKTVRIRADQSDGDIDKESKFYVLMHTSMPAILTENFFMDNQLECRELLMSRAGRQRITDFHVRAIERVLEECW